MSAPPTRRTRTPVDPDCATDPLCCRPLSAAVLDRPDAARLAQVLKALADPSRLQVISLIRTAPGGEVCVADLVAGLGLSQPTVSHHLRLLHEAGVLRRVRRASWVWYSVADERVDEVRRLLG